MQSLAKLLAFVLFTLPIAAQQANSNASNEAKTSNPTDGVLASPYHFFNLVSLESVTDKLNQYGASGFRFLAKTTMEGGAIQVMMERASGGPYEYGFGTGSALKHELEKSLNAWGAKGFRFVPLTLRMQATFLDYSALMEKGADRKCEYRVKMPLRKSNLPKDLAAGLTEGFRPVATDGAALPVVILERCDDYSRVDADSAADMYRAVSFGNLKQRKKKIEENTTAGYRIIDYGATSPGVLLLKREAESTEYKYITNDAKPPKLGEVDQDQVIQFQKQLDDAANEGFRLSRPSLAIRFSRWSNSQEFSALLERSPEKYEYRLVSADDTPDLSRKIAELHKEGFRPIPMGLLRGNLAVLERVIREGESNK